MGTLKSRPTDPRYPTRCSCEAVSGRILIHCRAGISRSATIVIGYLMQSKKWDLRTALHFVDARRFVRASTVMGGFPRVKFLVRKCSSSTWLTECSTSFPHVRFNPIRDSSTFSFIWRRRSSAALCRLQRTFLTCPLASQFDESSPSFKFSLESSRVPTCKAAHVKSRGVHVLRHRRMCAHDDSALFSAIYCLLFRLGVSVRNPSRRSSMPGLKGGDGPLEARVRRDGAAQGASWSLHI